MDEIMKKFDIAMLKVMKEEEEGEIPGKCLI